MPTFDTLTNATRVTATSVTFSHTVSTAGNPIILVGGWVGSTDDFTGVTYAGDSLTRVNGIAHSVPDAFSVLYARPNCATGANNVVVSLSASKLLHGVAWSYTNAKNEQPEAQNAANGQSTTPSVSVTTISDQATVTAWNVCDDTSSWDAGITSRLSEGAGPAAPAAVGDLVKTPAGATTMSVTIISSTKWAIIAASLAPQTLTGGTGMFLVFGLIGSILAPFAALASSITAIFARNVSQ